MDPVFGFNNFMMNTTEVPHASTLARATATMELIAAL